MKLPKWCHAIGDRMDDADSLKAFHKWATIWWCTFGVALSFLWANWIPWIVAMSLYANVAGEWAAWQATRVEVNQSGGKEKPCRDGARPKSRRSRA